MDAAFVPPEVNDFTRTRAPLGEFGLAKPLSQKFFAKAQNAPHPAGRCCVCVCACTSVVLKNSGYEQPVAHAFVRVHPVADRLRYSPECVEWMFCELRVDGVLRSSQRAELESRTPSARSER